jgi:cytochrome c
MSRSLEVIAALACIVAFGARAAGGPHAMLGRAPTADEVSAWNIDVRPDFEGLPKGSGSVEQGQQIWDNRCASCHGTFGESNSVFTPLVGGTTADDIKTGRAKTLSSNAPNRTALSTASTVSTLWDYIRRAMPWNAPKSLSNDEVYAVLAYLLNLGDILPSDFTLSDQNIREVQNRMPNRNGMVRFEGLWDRRGKPDVQNLACMSNCASEVKITSSLPEFARDAHGNLALQNRGWTAIRGANTEVPAGTPQVKMSPEELAATAPAVAAKKTTPSTTKLAEASGCLSCHGVTSKIVGPGFNEVAQRYKGDAGAPARLEAKVRAGGSGNWGQIPMPPQAAVSDDDLKALVSWVLAGAPAD